MSSDRIVSVNMPSNSDVNTDIKIQQNLSNSYPITQFKSIKKNSFGGELKVFSFPIEFDWPSSWGSLL